MQNGSRGRPRRLSSIPYDTGHRKTTCHTFRWSWPCGRQVCLPDSEMTLRLLCRAPTPALPDVALTAVQLLRRQLLRRAPVELTAPKRRVARGVPGKPSRVKAVPKPAKRRLTFRA